MYKLVTFSGYDNATGPHIFPIEPDVERTIGHIKMARPLPPKIENYIRAAKPIPGKTQLLIDAMGAGEFYGSNVNGDYFPEEALRHEGPDYGHQTFMHYAYPYKHHVNKDPARAYGEKVTLADYDPHMHRVLLIIRIDDTKCRDILSDLAKGLYWDVSMGCKVPWDQCSICKNKARNRAEYCPHLRYQMNRILQDGRRVFAYNHLPKFFDISFVTIGAEKASHVLKKVAYDGRHPEVRPSAELGELYYSKLSAANKRAAQNKRAEIDKDVPSQPAANVQGATPEDRAKMNTFLEDAGQVKSMERPIPNQALNAVAGFPLKKIFATIAALGIDLRPQEFQRIILVKQGAAKFADQLERHRLVFDETNPGPAAPAWSREFANLTEDDVSEKVAMILRPFVADRSCYPEILHARLQQMEKTADFDGYNRKNQWYPMTEEGTRLSSGQRSIMPASLALAGGFLVFRRAFPGLITKGPSPVKALAKHPWLLPILIGAGIGASVGFDVKNKPMALTPHGTGRGLDGNDGPAYHQSKTAGMNPLARVGLIPLAYIYSGVQQKRWRQGARLNAFDRFAAMRPDLAGLASFAMAPRVMKGLHSLTKRGSAISDMAMYAIGSSSRLMPAVLAGAAIDTAIFKAITRLAQKRKGPSHGYSK
jgi:hypothetical protein